LAAETPSSTRGGAKNRARPGEKKNGGDWPEKNRRFFILSLRGVPGFLGRGPLGR